MTWGFRLYLCIFDDFFVYVENPSQVDKWNMNDCKKWLKRYGLNFEGNLDDLRSTILMHKKSPLPLLEVNQSCSSHNICT